jgi:hypothetical protein
MYNCGGETNDHCIGLVAFNVLDLDAGGFRAFGTEMEAFKLVGGDGELNREIWVVQRAASTNNCPKADCWVEVGLTSGGCKPPSSQIKRRMSFGRTAARSKGSIVTI